MSCYFVVAILIMKQACLLLISLFFLLQPANALLPAPKGARTEQAGSPPAQNHLQRHQPILSILPFREKRRIHGPRQNPYDRYIDTSSGTISLICAALALVCIGGVAITSFSLLLIPVFLFATLAAVFGAIGVKRHKPGYAIAGMTLGMLEIVAGFLLLALLL